MKKSAMVFVAVTLAAFASPVLSQIYKCDGPDGPVYTDRKCGPEAVSIEFPESSGITGVSDEVKAELARKKAEREAAGPALKPNPSANPTYQFNTINTEPAGYWLPGYYRPPGHRPSHQPLPPQPPASDPSTIRLKR